MSNESLVERPAETVVKEEKRTSRMDHDTRKSLIICSDSKQLNGIMVDAPTHPF